MPKTTSDYSKGLIYAITEIATCEVLYVGSTTNLEQRRFKHKSNSNLLDSKAQPIHTYINSIGWDNVSMEVHHYFPCQTKQELLREEGLTQRELKPSHNKLIAGRTHEEYHNENREKISMQRKDYREGENRENILDCQRKYYEANKEVLKQLRREYYEKNKEEINEKRRLYRELHKDEINEAAKEKINCEVCQTQINKNTVAQHNRTVKHQKNLGIVPVTKPKKVVSEEEKEKRIQYMKEYNERNNEKNILYRANYNLAHKEERQEKGKERAMCEVCNIELRKADMSKHVKTQKHQANLERKVSAT